MQTDWRKCSTCKSPIRLGAKYWACNVSTCNRERTGLVFCSVNCWDAHVPVLNHRDAWSVEKTAPASLETPSTHVSKPAVTGGPQMSEEESKSEVLIVASKMKTYIREKSGMNTSAAVLDVLSQKVRELCDRAIEVAKTEGRKTVMDRDFQ